MSGQFKIQVDPLRDLVRIRMSGFFATSDVERFIEERRRAHAQLRCAPNQHLTLNDVSGMKIQSQEVVAAFQAMMAESGYRSRRLAFVVSSTLARSQLMRACVGRDMRCFEDVASAERWLFGEAVEGQAEPPRRATG